MPQVPFPRPVSDRAEYQMRDLGYERTPCDRAFELTVCHRLFRVPAQVVVDDRDKHYKDEEEDTWGLILSGGLDEYDLTDWAINNMNWPDLAPWAYEIPSPPYEPTVEDFQEAWWGDDGMADLVDAAELAARAGDICANPDMSETNDV